MNHYIDTIKIILIELFLHTYNTNLNINNFQSPDTVTKIRHDSLHPNPTKRNDSIMMEESATYVRRDAHVVFIKLVNI